MGKKYIYQQNKKKMEKGTIMAFVQQNIHTKYTFFYSFMFVLFLLLQLIFLLFLWCCHLFCLLLFFLFSFNKLQSYLLCSYCSLFLIVYMLSIFIIDIVIHIVEYCKSIHKIYLYINIFKINYCSSLNTILCILLL